MLYAMCYHHSPFETPDTVARGGSIAMAVQSGKYKHPTAEEGRWTVGTKELIDSCLKLKPEERLGVGEIVERCEEILGRLGGR